MASQVESILNLPAYAIYGLKVSNNATTPDSKIDISAGICRDDQNNVDLVLGSLFPNAEGSSYDAPLVIDAAVNGVNGLDSGSLAASTVYAVYLIGDSRGYKVPAGLLSLASNANPTMPFDYDSKRLIGYMVTDSSSDFLLGYTYGNGNDRQWVYDAPQATAITAGASATYAAVDLGELVPPVQNTPVAIVSDFNANAADDILNLQGFDSTGDAVHIVAQVAGSTAHIWSNDEVLAQLDTANPEINYKVSAGAVALKVAGFKFSL